MSIDFEQLNKSVLTEHNRIRQDPTSYIPILRQMLNWFKGSVLYKPKEIPLETNEGPAAVEEAISFLKKQKPLDPLTYDERLSKACEDHVRDIGPKGLLSHEGTDGRSMSDRVEAYLEWDNNCGENIDLGGKTGQDVIVSLLVDDGNMDRGHRANIFKAEFIYIGISSGPHREYETITVLDYAGGIRDKGKPYHNYDNFKYQFPKELGVGFKQPTQQQEKKKELTRQQKNAYQVQDEDAPANTVSVKIVKRTKEFRGKVVAVTKKIYTLDDGSQQIVEIEEF